MGYPSSIICLTEETVETLYLLGREDLIMGVSQYVERPAQAKNHPQVSQFLRSDIEKIVSMKPDLVIGFSDIQKDIAKDLIGQGLNVLVTNQRTLEEILQQILFLGRIIGEEQKASMLVDKFRAQLKQMRERASTFQRPPRVYFEEWDHPRLSGIGWVSELIEVCGGVNVFKNKTHALARGREVSDEEIIAAQPDVIFGCWCGKKVKIESITQRANYQSIPAVQNNFIWELPPEIFLQPGPALFVDGLTQMFEYLARVASHHP